MEVWILDGGPRPNRVSGLPPLGSVEPEGAVLARRDPLPMAVIGSGSFTVEAPNPPNY